MFVILAFLAGFFVGAVIWSLVVEARGDRGLGAREHGTQEVRAQEVREPRAQEVFKCGLCGETAGRRGPFKSQRALDAHVARCPGWP